MTPTTSWPYAEADSHDFESPTDLVGAVQVDAGLTLVTKVGAGSFIGFTVTAASITEPTAG